MIDYSELSVEQLIAIARARDEQVANLRIMEDQLRGKVETLQSELEDKAVFDNPEDCWASHRALEQQAEELSKYPEVVDWEEFWNGAAPSDFYQEAAKRAYLTGRNYYPENSVRALFDYFYEYEDQDMHNKSYLDFRYNEIRLKLAAIFKEKQGEGK